MVKFLILFTLTFSSHGQDERLFREFYYQADRKKAEEISQKYTWQAWGKVYHYDLDDDGDLEALQMVKKNQQDWFYIRDQRGHVLGKFHLETKGRESGVYRIKINRIGNDLKLLGLYFYDGFVESSEFYATASLYFLTFRPSRPNSMKLTKGPSIWLEHKARIRYLQRDYNIKLKDLNQDGIKEVIVYKGHTQRIFQYSPKHGMVSINI